MKIKHALPDEINGIRPIRPTFFVSGYDENSDADGVSKLQTTINREGLDRLNHLLSILPEAQPFKKK